MDRLSDSLLITEVRIPGREGLSDNLMDILVSGSKISSIAPTGELRKDEADAVVEGKGNIIIPGLVDLHVHFRQPGFEYKETILGGSQAAFAGGFTTVCTMPNLSPAPDCIENIEVQMEAIRRDACIDVRPYATITKERKGRECVDFERILNYCKEKGINLAGFSDDGSGVQDEEPMRKALEESARLGFMVAAHCEVNSLLRGGYIHDGEFARLHGMKGICSESEYREVERDIRLAGETGGHIHICHISTKESVDLVRKGKALGINVTCETAPHYLIFSDADLKDEGRFKMNPPIRSEADREALREGVVDGTIDVIATDHAPHSEEEKSRGLAKSAMGIVGLETSFSAVYTSMVESGLISFGTLVERMSLTPRRLLGMTGADSGIIREGATADLTLVDTTSRIKVDSRTFHGMGRATPFDSMELTGRVVKTIKN